MTRWANFRSSSAFRLRGKHRASFGIAHETPISIQDLGQLPNHTDRAALARVLVEKADAFDMREALGLINSDESKNHA
jgi:hypothetical protein